MTQPLKPFSVSRSRASVAIDFLKDVVRVLVSAIFIGIIFALAFLWPTGCTTVEPIARDVCTVVGDICSYHSILCDTSNWYRTALTREDILDSLDRLSEELRAATHE